MSSISSGITNAIIKWIKKSAKNNKKLKAGVATWPVALAVVGAICFGFFICLALATLFTNAEVWTTVGFLLFAMLGLILIVAFINCRITYDEAGFQAKSFFGIKRYYTYGQITGMKEKPNETYIYMGKRKVMVDGIGSSGIHFTAFANAQYRKLHGGKPIPKFKASPKDIFKGNLKDPGGIIVAFCLLLALGIGFTIFAIAQAYWMPFHADNTIRHQVCLRSCVQQDDDLLIRSSDNTLYKVRNLDDQVDVEAIKAICDGKTIVTTYSKEYEPKKSEKYFCIKAIMVEDSYIFTFEDSNRLNRNASWLLIGFAIIIDVVIFGFIGFTVFLGRNPQKFSPKVRNALIKKDYWNI